MSIVKVSSATLPQGVVGWRQVTTTRRSQVSRLVAIQGVPSQSYVQRCFWPAPVQHHHGYERPFSRMGPSCPMVGVYVRWNCPSLIKSGCGAWWWNWCGGRRMRSTLWQGQSCKAFSVGLPDIKVSPLSWILRHTCEFIWNGLILAYFCSFFCMKYFVFLNTHPIQRKEYFLEKPLPKNAHASNSET